MSQQHPRQNIRAILRKLLLDQTIAQAQVFTHRKTPLFEMELPCLLIYMNSETSTQFLESPKTFKRTLSTVIEGIVQGIDEIDDKLDHFAAQIEAVLKAYPTLNDHVSHHQLVQTTVEVDGQGAQLIGSIVLTYELVYYD